MTGCATQTPPPPYIFRAERHGDPFPRFEHDFTGELVSSFASDMHACMRMSEPRRGPSTKSEHIIFDRTTPTMSASSETYETSVQVVENLIDSDLIDEPVAELQSGVTPAKDDITTRMDWTPACQKLRNFFATNIHPKVCA